MSHYGLLGDISIHEAEQDVRGSVVYGLDAEKLGKIDDVVFDHVTGEVTYVVVDTGGWLKTKKFIVLAKYLRYSSRQQYDFNCDLTKEQIETLPPYEDSHLESEEKWNQYEHRYRAKWDESPIMHRSETDRNITPTTQQLQGTQSANETAKRAKPVSTGEAAEKAVGVASTPTERIVPAGQDSVVNSTSPVGIGSRWDTFQARLRQRRKEVVARCTSCAALHKTTELKRAS